MFDKFFDNGMLTLKPNSDGQYVYCAGDLIKGSIDFTLSSPVKCRSLTVYIAGKSKIYGPKKKKNSTEHIRHENYLDKKIVLFANMDPVELSTEPHHYDFEFYLPLKLPQTCKTRAMTFDNSFNISYYCKAVIDVPWGKDLVSKKEFEVKRLDLMHMLPMFQSPTSKVTEEKISGFCGCCSEEKLFKMTVQLPRTGYAIGQTIPMKFSFENQGNYQIKMIEVKLKQSEVFMYPGTLSPLHHEELPENLARIKKQLDQIVMKNTKVMTLNRVPIFNDNATFELEYELDIPQSVAISDLIYSQTIKRAHEISINVSVSGKSNKLKLRIPIIIGPISSYEKGDELPDVSSKDIEYLNKYLQKGFVKSSWAKSFVASDYF
ncbi:hypothetical protein PVAND_016635 [Polypedilum vanderplanki]|uniref:Arrestin C-terminal-like domain-containing protein n=1 Tax=Polypedilum vanderplanki TaxID=319348 RepID=A0A9J6BG62_POLVA|nr:hypothetical protein PVAND_016635 [Polypedilum vanderplanki]